jgi:hypothetical protein
VAILLPKASPVGNPAEVPPEPLRQAVPALVPPTPRTNGATVDVSSSIADLRQGLARRDYDLAQAALDRGDHGAALLDADRALRILGEAGQDPEASELRDAVEQLVLRATMLRTSDEKRIYTLDDEGVTPPAALGRQMPANPPTGMSPQLVGTLEMVINQRGEVETLRLHTPLNRYHERMIVSAAKAWRYRPALRNGRPVRFLLVSTINLPES